MKMKKVIALTLMASFLLLGAEVMGQNKEDCTETIYDKKHEKNIRKLEKKWVGQKQVVLQKNWGGSSYSSKYTNTKYYSYKNICGTDYYIAVSFQGQGLDAWVMNLQYVPHNNIPK